MKIVIDIEQTGNPSAPRYRAQITVGETQTAMPTCLSEQDAITDATNYIQQEYRRGDYSKFALFRKACVHCKGPLNREFSCVNQCAGNGRD